MNLLENSRVGVTSCEGRCLCGLPQPLGCAVEIHAPVDPGSKLGKLADAARSADQPRPADTSNCAPKRPFNFSTLRGAASWWMHTPWTWAASASLPATS